MSTNKPKAVFLDYRDINPGDISLKPLEELCDLTAYVDSTAEEALERAADAEIIFTDSCVINRRLIEACPKLRYVGVMATGINHIDLDAATEHEITVTNVPAYSTDAVAQHAIALLLSVTNKISRYEEGDWPEDKLGTLPVLLNGKSIGIVGYGNIGKRTAGIAEALGMTVNVYSRDPEAAITSDVVSMHCPLTPENRGMVNREFISQMKDGAIFINTARGGLVDEEALAEALNSGKIYGAGLDVTVKEPISKDSPLLKCKNCYITPHVAFMPKETREKVVNIAARNLQMYLEI